MIATTACGSLREEYAPGDLVCLSDFIDLTTQRLKTHVGTAVETGGPRLEKFLGQCLMGHFSQSDKPLINHHASAI